MIVEFSVLVILFTVTLAEETPVLEFTSGNNLFTASVYRQLKKTESGNFLVSPFSAGVVLALAQSGAKDTTAEEIRTSVYLPQNQQNIETAVRALQPQLRRNRFYTLKSANKIYVKEGFKIRDDFRKTAIDVFDSDLEEINFENNVEAAGVINDWVEGRTEHKIKNLIRPDLLNDRTRSVLVNALYFKANWSDTFAGYATSKQEFFRNARERVVVDTMYDKSRRNYFESKDLDAKFLELEFEGGDVSMTIVLPNKIDGIANLENRMEEILKVPEYTRQQVIVVLPKFKIESGIDFSRILKQLGVQKAFKGDEADLSGIAGKKGDLVLDEVVQKTFIDVNEQGVEAAAASFAVVAVPLSGHVPSTPPKEFKADHPFIFYIKVRDLVIFAGRVIDPSA